MAIRKELIDQGLHFPSWERDHTDVKSIGAANKARRRNNARRKAKSEAGQGQKRGKEEQDDSDESPSQSKGKEKKHEREGQDESDAQPPRSKARIVPPRVQRTPTPPPPPTRTVRVEESPRDQWDRTNWQQQWTPSLYPPASASANIWYPQHTHNM